MNPIFGMHIVPIDETTSHETRHPCPCQPRTDVAPDETGQYGFVFVHNSLEKTE